MDTDLFLLNKLSKLKDGNSGGGGGVAGGYLISPKNPSTNNYHVRKKPFYTVYSTNTRYAYDGQEWASSNAQGSFSTAAQYGASDRRAIFFAGREEMDRSRDDKIYNHTHGGRSRHNTSQKLQGSLRHHCGINQMQHIGRWHDNYGSFGTRLLFLRNPTDSNVSANLYWQHSTRYTHSHDGSCLIEYTPNNTAYSNVSGVAHSTIWSYTSDNWHGQSDVQITLTPGQTRAFALCTNFMYYTNTNNGYLIWETNSFHRTNDTLDSGLEIDLKATQHYLCNRQPNYTGSDSGNQDLITFWKSLGEAFGDNE
jgi:hypothetical protein